MNHDTIIVRPLSGALGTEIETAPIREWPLGDQQWSRELGFTLAILT